VRTAGEPVRKGTETEINPPGPEVQYRNPQYSYRHKEVGSDAAPIPWTVKEGTQLDPDDPGEVGTRFATKGSGWSGRDAEDDDPLS
jgi:hypothetical protein